MEKATVYKETADDQEKHKGKGRNRSDRYWTCVLRLLMLNSFFSQYAAEFTSSAKPRRSLHIV